MLWVLKGTISMGWFPPALFQVSTLGVIAETTIDVILHNNEYYVKYTADTKFLHFYGYFSILLVQLKLLFVCLFVCLISFFSLQSTIFQSGRVFLGWTSTKQGLMCLAQGHNTVTPVMLEPVPLRFRVNHSTTEPLRSPSSYCIRLQTEGFKKWVGLLQGITKRQRWFLVNWSVRHTFLPLKDWKSRVHNSKGLKYTVQKKKHIFWNVDKLIQREIYDYLDTYILREY